ncbi:MAG: cupin domain-containing protein [Telmatospirillum sp.]|nr:cupin domain-containing protein [Telmatospirillum sp.]
MTVLDPKTIAPRVGTNYPEPYRSKLGGREKRVVGDAVGLKNFGVNLVRLPPGAMSAMRHWHTRQDEFVYVLEGTAMLLSDAGKTPIPAGSCAGFPAGTPDGHCIVNETDRDVVYLEVGDRTSGDVSTYPDADMMGKFVHSWAMTRKDGSPL